MGIPQLPALSPRRLSADTAKARIKDPDPLSTSDADKGERTPIKWPGQ